MTELGKILKENRELKGLSLDELQSITKIQKRYLLGIEEGNYSMMPGKFYVRAFIKQYAEAVGLDPDQLFDEYKNEIPATYNEELPEQLSRVQSRKGLSPDASKVFDILPKILIGVFIVGAFTLIWYLIVQNAGNDAKEPVTSEKGPTKVEEKEDLPEEDKDAAEDEEKEKADEEASEDSAEEVPAQELASVSTSGSNSVYDLKNAEKFVVKIVSLGQTWVGLSNGSGKMVFQETLDKNKNASRTEDMTNETQAVINVGRAPETEIYINDQKLEYAIPPEKDMTQIITINFVK